MVSDGAKKFWKYTGFIALGGVLGVLGYNYLVKNSAKPSYSKREESQALFEEGELRMGTLAPYGDEGDKATVIVPEGRTRSSYVVKGKKNITGLEERAVFDYKAGKFVPQQRIDLVPAEDTSLSEKLSADERLLKIAEDLEKILRWLKWNATNVNMNGNQGCRTLKLALDARQD